LGYLHAPDLTIARFMKNPFGTGRVYRTGIIVVDDDDDDDDDDLSISFTTIFRRFVP